LVAKALKGLFNIIIAISSFISIVGLFILYRQLAYTLLPENGSNIFCSHQGKSKGNETRKSGLEKFLVANPILLYMSRNFLFFEN
jgi:hypothetical protein